jgi:hypothetical protein
MKTFFRGTLAALLALIAGCGESEDHSGHDHGPAHQHEHRPPHGGTALVLGDEAFHLELVRNPAEGLMTCYVLDAHMENFVRISEPSFTVEAEVGGAKKVLEFLAVPNAATGEKIGDSSQFDARAEWLRTTTNFTGRISGFNVRGAKFTEIRFRYPEGNE